MKLSTHRSIDAVLSASRFSSTPISLTAYKHELSVEWVNAVGHAYTAQRLQTIVHHIHCSLTSWNRFVAFRLVALFSYSVWMTARNNVVNYAADDGRATSAGRVLAKCHPQSVPVCRPLGRIFHQIRPAETFFSADIQISRILLKLQNSAKIRLNTRNSATETITPPSKKTN